MEYICSSCGCVVSENDYYLFNDEIYCDECFHDNTRECDCCGTRILNDEDEGDDNITLCSRCRSDYYCECFRCGRIIHNDDVSYNEDDDPYCHNCYDIDNCNKRIHSYSYKPDPIFFGI